MKTLYSFARLTDPRATEQELYDLLRDLRPDAIDSDSYRQIISLLKDAADPQALDFLSGLDASDHLFDCSGTGGSGLPRFNTSTAVAFVLACAGVKVVKFGNRAASGRTGSFDFLDGLGYPSVNSCEIASTLMAETGLVFLFAPAIYPALARLAAVRRIISGSTVMNFVGPLLNPVRISYRLLGVSHPRMQNEIAQVLADDRDIQNALLVRGDRGLDEIDSVGNTFVTSVSSGQIQSSVICADSHTSAAGKSASKMPFVSSFSVADNVAAFFRVLAGKVQDEAFQLVVLNAGAALHVANVVSNLDDGCLLAEELLISGRVLRMYQSCRRVYERVSCGNVSRKVERNSSCEAKLSS